MWGLRISELIVKGLKYVFYGFLDAFLSILPIPPFKNAILRLFGAKIGKNCIIQPGVRLLAIEANGFKNLSIGDDVYIGKGSLLDVSGNLVIKHKVSISANVTILTHQYVHTKMKESPLYKLYPPFTGTTKINEYSYIGACSTILAGVEIGPYSMVGAGAVVTKNVPPKRVVAGVPAEVLKKIESKGDNDKKE